MGVTESHLLALPGDTLAEDDAEWMPGKSRTRLTPDLDNGFLMDVPRSLDQDLFEEVQTRMRDPVFRRKMSERMWKSKGLFANYNRER